MTIRWCPVSAMAMSEPSSLKQIFPGKDSMPFGRKSFSGRIGNLCDDICPLTLKYCRQIRMIPRRHVLWPSPIRINRICKKSTNQMKFQTLKQKIGIIIVLFSTNLARRAKEHQRRPAANEEHLPQLAISIVDHGMWDIIPEYCIKNARRVLFLLEFWWMYTCRTNGQFSGGCYTKVCWGT